MDPKQGTRPAAIATPLGDDKLLLKSFSGTESLGRPFRFDAECYAPDLSIDFDQLIGQNVTVRMILKENQTRYFNGYVSRVSQVISANNLHTYRLTIVPWLWFLTRCADCRIFQDMTVPEIIRKIFRDRGFSDFKENLSGSYPQRNYTVQYRETDFNFVSRLMEQEGIYYFFTHENGRHELVLADSPQAHDAFPGYDSATFHERGSGFDLHDPVRSLTLGKELQPGAYALKDFDFEKPAKDLAVRSAIPRQHANSEFEIFDYPGDYRQYSDGEGVSRRRAEELGTQFEVVSGSGEARGMAAGSIIKIDETPRKDQARKYLLTTVTHSIVQDEYGAGASARGPGRWYDNSFVGIDAQVHYRPPRITPRPVVQGPQTAIVVGKSGEEIWTDKYGRVKLQFHWDRYSKANESSSCWVRVAQVWAGKKWGGMFIPRIGQEVIVEFLEGDPDQPIITGRVYNGETMPPYDLPGNATRSTLKSISSKGGDGFNELRFEDKKGSEQIFIHAQKDYDERVKNDSKTLVEKDRHINVKGDRLEQVSGDQHQIVKGDQAERVDGGVSLKVGMDLQEKVGGKHALEAGTEIHLKAGMNVVLEAGMSITLKAGGGFVVVGPTGVTISGMPVLINSGGAAGSGSGCQVDTPREAKEADDGESGDITKAPAAGKPPKAVTFSAAATALKQAAQDGSAFCDIEV